MNSWFDGFFVTILILSSQVLNLLESRVLTNWSFWVLEKTPILFDLPLISHDLLIFWRYVHGVDVKLSSKFRWIWTLFARDLTFEALFVICLGATSLTGL